MTIILLPVPFSVASIETNPCVVTVNFGSLASKSFNADNLSLISRATIPSLSYNKSFCLEKSSLTTFCLVEQTDAVSTVGRNVIPREKVSLVTELILNIREGEGI